MNRDTILIVDDCHEFADFLAKMLSVGLGYENRVVYKARSAIEVLRSQPISLMLLDLEMPNLSGIEMLAELAREKIYVPTILITAEGSEQIAVEAFRLGVVDYLTKPVDVDTMQAAIERALTETQLRKEKEKLTKQLEEQNSWLTVLSKVGQSLTSTLDLDETLRKIVEAGVFLTNAEEGFLALLDEESGQLYLRAGKNIDENKSKTMRLPLDDSLVGNVIQSGRPYRSSRISNSPDLKVCTGFLVHSLLYVPLLSGGKAVGVLSIDNRSSRRVFTERDEAQLMSIADYAVIALQNARFFNQAQKELNERKRVEQALRVSEERFVLAVQGANDGLWDWDLQTNHTFYSPRWKAILGYQDSEIGSSPEEWFKRIHPEDIERTRIGLSNHFKKTSDQFQVEHRLLHKDGSYRWTLSKGLAVRNQSDAVIRMAGSLTDITDRKAAEEKLLHDAFYDPLTGLPNRALFMDHLRFAVERAKRRPEYHFGVLFLDIDHFKNVNDSQGHLAGDQLLIAIAHTLMTGVRTTDLVSRLSGDEFVILLEEIEQDDAVCLAERIQSSLSTPFRLLNQDVFVTASIGIVLSHHGYFRAEDVLRDADIAMYAAKASGKERYEIFKPAMRDRITERIQLETELYQALENQQLKLFYQPILCLQTARLAGLEVTVYWDHPRRGLLPPAAFLPLAEETRLIVPLFEWMLLDACRQLQRWQNDFSLPSAFTLIVPIPARQFTQAGFLAQVEKVLQDTVLDPHNLTLKIDESAIAANEPASVRILNQLRQMGIRIQVDDFGLGYSSLSQLSRLPLDSIRLDPTFTNQANDEKQFSVLEAIITLAHRLGFEVVAEGISLETELKQLQSLACEYGQGPLLSEPLRTADIRSLLSKDKETQFEFAASTS